MISNINLLNDENCITISNSSIKLVIFHENNCYKKKYYIRKNNEWIELLSSGSDSNSEIVFNNGKENINLFFDNIQTSVTDENKTTIILSGNYENLSFSETITLENESNFIHSQLNFYITENIQISKLISVFCFSPEGKIYSDYKPLDLIFTPNLKAEESHVIGDHIFRSPATILQKEDLAFALIPDIQILNENRKMKTAMDLNIEKESKPMASFGFMNWEVDGHVFYKHTNQMISQLENSELTYGFYIYLDSNIENQCAHQKVIRFMYEKYFIPFSDKNTGALNKPIEIWAKDCWYKYANDVWMDVNINNEECGALRIFRLAWSNNLPEYANNDAWFNVWFQCLRTAYGMYIFGKYNSDSELMNKGIKVLKLALNAPQKEGIFPSIFYQHNGPHWIGDHIWGGIGDNYYPTFHDSFQCFIMLQWYNIIDDINLKEKILSFTKSYAEFLIKNQYESGVIPSWFEMNTLSPAPTMEKINAESSASALFLIELYKITNENKYINSAIKIVNYLENNIIPKNKWFDYETFFSCSRKPIDFYDQFTKQYPQNTLSLYTTIEMYKSLYSITKEISILNKGLRLLDYLLLYQQVWSPSFLSRKLLGGFGVQNTDGEWSDARQAYFAITLLDFYEITKQREYFERAVEAARATFGCYEENSPRCYENYAHSGYDRITGVTGISWGTGSAMISLSIIQNKYGDLFINVNEKWGKAINYFWIENLSIENNRINFNIIRPDNNLEEVNIIFGNFNPEIRYELLINNKKIGEYNFSQNCRIKFLFNL
ncbi:MAG TPA: hypothetical protein VIR55_10445 [Ignavibacteria bacterium]